MLELPIQIRRGAVPIRSATAWFLPGGEAHLWIAEILRWDVSQGDLRLWVVPMSAADRHPRGLLVTSGGHDKVNATPRCHPFGQLGNRLYLPVDAVVEPAVDAVQVDELLAGTDTIYLWHPASGLVGFEPADAMQPHDLIELPLEREELWDAAEPGLHLSDRLVSVIPSQPVTIEQFLAEGGDDIGAQSSQIDQLPPIPDLVPSSPAVLARTALSSAG